MRRIKPKGKPFEVTDGATNGLQLRVNPTGRKTWYYRYARPDGRRERLRLGGFPAVPLATARQLAGQAAIEREQHGVPVAATRKGTVEELLIEWRDVYLKKNRKTWPETWRLLKKDVVPLWGDRQADKISRREAALLLDKICERAPIVANRVAGSIKQAWAFGVDRGLLEFSTFAGMKNPAKERKRSRVLSLEELALIWKALPGPMSPNLANVFKLLMLTGQRRGEVTGLHADEVDGDIWTIPPNRAKNGKEHRVPLTAEAMNYIPNSGYAFPGPSGNPISADAISRATGRLREELDLPHWTAHDIRRSVASGLANMRVSREVIISLLNHTDSSVTARYDQDRREKEVREALQAWSLAVCDRVADG